MGGKPSLGRMMTRIGWWLVDVLSRMLDADERQAVRGDLAESGGSVIRAIRDVLDLIVRRQIGLWGGLAALAGLARNCLSSRSAVESDRIPP